MLNFESAEVIKSIIEGNLHDFQGYLSSIDKDLKKFEDVIRGVIISHEKIEMLDLLEKYIPGSKNVEKDLMCAVENNNPKMLRFFIEKRKINVKPFEGEILNKAVTYNKLKNFKYLVEECGCDVKKYLSRLYTTAAYFNRVNILKYLAENLNFIPQDTEDREKILKEAVVGSSKEAALYLIERLNFGSNKIEYSYYIEIILALIKKGYWNSKYDEIISLQTLQENKNLIYKEKFAETIIKNSRDENKKTYILQSLDTYNIKKEKIITDI